MWVRSGGVRLSQTRPIPRSPDGDNNGTLLFGKWASICNPSSQVRVTVMSSFRPPYVFLKVVPLQNTWASWRIAHNYVVYMYKSYTPLTFLPWYLDWTWLAQMARCTQKKSSSWATNYLVKTIEKCGLRVIAVKSGRNLMSPVNQRTEDKKQNMI